MIALSSYSTPEAVAGFLKDFQMRINHQEKGTFSPAHVRYFLTISRYGKEFSTSFESNPAVHGEPTVTQVFSALADDALTMRSYGLDEFVDEFCEGMKPSAALRAYNSCKETYDWMRDELYLSGSEIAEISDTLSEHEDEVNALVEKATAERAAREAYDHPKVPAGFVTIEELQGDLDLGDWGDQVEDFDCDLTDAIQEVADGAVDSSYHDLLAWLPDNAEWLEEADAQGLLEGCKGDIYRMIQMAQYECFSQDLYDHREDICKNVTLSQLASEGIYAIRTDVADDLLGDLDYDGDSVQTDEAKDAITGAIYATFQEKYGEDFAECATDFVRDNDDITGRVNPCALSAETVRAVNESGYDAVFAEQWKDELSECDIDPDAVSIESEAHDMANGKDELSGDTPAKDAPAKGGHEEPPSGTDDNR